MTVSYLDTLQSVRIATNGGAGLGYAEITKAMRVHVRSLVAEGHVAAFAESDVQSTTLDDPKGRLFLTVQGVDYVNLFVEAGLLSDMAEITQEPKARTSRKTTARRRRTAKPKASQATVPTPTESVHQHIFSSCDGEWVCEVDGCSHREPQPKVTVVAPSKKGPQPSGKTFDPSPSAQQTVHTEVTASDRIAALETLVEGLANAILTGSLR